MDKLDPFAVGCRLSDDLGWLVGWIGTGSNNRLLTGKGEVPPNNAAYSIDIAVISIVLVPGVCPCFCFSFGVRAILQAELSGVWP